jgi:hypothetical protein
MVMHCSCERIYDPDQLLTREVGSHLHEIGFHPLHAAVELFMLMDGTGHQVRLTISLIHVGEEVCFFVVVVRRYALNPSQAVTDQVGPIKRLLYTGGLLVDAVKATNETLEAL